MTHRGEWGTMKCIIIPHSPLHGPTWFVYFVFNNNAVYNSKVVTWGQGHQKRNF